MPRSVMDSDIPSERFPPRLARLGFQGRVRDGIELIVPPVRSVPAGVFLMGSDPTKDHVARKYAKYPWAKAERPQHTMTLPNYDIARFPVTVAEYACFVRAGHQVRMSNWATQLGQLDHPVVQVSWRDAVAYAVWLTKRTGEQWQLASEAEWEKAARGIEGRIYPWGDTFDQARCNTRESGLNTTTPVGSFPSAVSPCGAQDLAGNVWEWTSSRFLPYPYTLADGREDKTTRDSRVLRGGSWGNDFRSARAACRTRNRPGVLGDLIGFRLVRIPFIS
jgi:toxoflavin biosynthesis protein ToxD